MQHKDLAMGRWQTLSFLEQMANVGSEIERTIKWKHKLNKEYAILAFDRALELLDLTIADSKNISKLKELTRTREMIADHFVFDNVYNSTCQEWQKYFYSFNYAVAIQKM
jgi:hypothetical protein